ncbi:hypothetical protein NDU88_004183 [Pleurodeles waltl]|uniref:Uncharacterized protein n=1 Tax=Pleurodeles waltl TaxID=8319 RepID=A0AAV7M961_PLEWA|nr:hypothetical protein NDU88_004183 [Pleurodeles waltl]
MLALPLEGTANPTNQRGGQGAGPDTCLSASKAPPVTRIAGRLCCCWKGPQVPGINMEARGRGRVRRGTVSYKSYRLAQKQMFSVEEKLLTSGDCIPLLSRNSEKRADPSDPGRGISIEAGENQERKNVKNGCVQKNSDII